MIFRFILSSCIFFSFVFMNCRGVVCEAFGAPWQLRHLLKTSDVESPLHNPTALYIDRESRRYYVVDYNNNRLVSFDDSGKFLNAFNGGGQLVHPFDMIKEGSNTIIVLEKSQKALTQILLHEKDIKRHQISNKGKIITPYRIEKLADAMIILDGVSGEIFSVNYDFEVTGKFSSSVSSEGFSNFIIKDNALWALQRSGHKIIKFSPDASELGTIIIGQPSALSRPVSFDMDKNGNFYMLDRFTRAISVFTAHGSYQYSFLKKGTKAPDLAYPIEIKFDFDGNLCVVDEGNGKVGVYSR